MQKPITITRKEFIENIVETINDSGLPFFIIEPILKDLLDSVRQGAEAQLEKDRAAYQEYLREEAEKEEAQESTNSAEPSGMEG